MPSQIFKRPIPNEMLFTLLDTICLKHEKHYTFSIESYKKGMFTGTIEPFLEACVPYYFMSKRTYLSCPPTHKSFLTVLRQICNHNGITYTSQIKYDKSAYDIIYYIYSP